jgi:hypothetical protein
VKPEIFISHSCKDKETARPVGLSPEQIKARAERLSFAHGLREDLHQRLTEDGRFTVFLDVRGGLKPGDVWQEGIHRALATCSGAVILLSPEALLSGWVLKEATILSWRVFMGERVKVVPVLLGVTRKDLVEKGFGAVSLDAIQWVEVPEATDPYREDAVKKILAAFAALPTSAEMKNQTWRDVMQRWTSELSHQLRNAVPVDLKEQYLREMYGALAMEPNLEGRFAADPFVDIAAQVLTADTNQVIRVLYQAGMPNSLQREEMCRKVRPLWVDPNAANLLPFAARSGRVVVIDAESNKVARDYILRAYCTRINADRMLEPSDVNDGTLDQIIVAVEDYLADYLPIENPKELSDDVTNNGPIYVILGPGIARSDLLDTLTERYGQLTLVAVGGPHWRKRLGAWAQKALLLRPLLQPNRERDGLRFRNKLELFVKGQD